MSANAPGRREPSPRRPGAPLGWDPDRLLADLAAAPLLREDEIHRFVKRRYSHRSRRPRLTPRRRQVLQLLAEGHTTDQIAALLHLSRWSVRDHADDILLALHARNRAHAIHLAHQAGILNTGERQPRPVP